MARKKGSAGNDDVFQEWVRPVSWGREGGIRVYVDQLTLRMALEEAGLDPRLKAVDLEVLRTTMKAGKQVAQVLLKIRPRRCAHGLVFGDCLEHKIAPGA